MHLRISLLLVTAAALNAQTFAVLPDNSDGWVKLLGSIGLQPESAESASVVVARAGTAASPEWMARVQSGTLIVLEGESPLAASFGFHATANAVTLASIEDVHRPALPVVLQKPLEISKFEIPPDAKVFARERWAGAPLVAGFTKGAGAVLWVATDPGPQGYERYPYLLQAMHDLGMNPPLRSARLWAFFDYSYRTRVDVDYFARRWRKAGIAGLHVAAWHFYDAEAGRDDYLNKLIEACHRNGILVYAWIELPHVSEKFWNDHPEWREKTALQQDAQLDWRKLMNLQNRDCFNAASAGIRNLVGRFNWDGVNLAELYFESLEGMGNPARFTPMNADVRRAFQAEKGFDPADLFSTRKDAASARLFLDYRAELARKMQNEWLALVEDCRHAHPDLDIVLTHVDDRFDTGMKDAIGADAARVLPLLDTHEFTFLIEDPATIWNLGPQRYAELAKRYAPLTPTPGKLAIDINIVERYQDVYPTKQQTGAELFQLVHVASESFPRVALYFENSILPPDLSLLPSAGSAVSSWKRNGTEVALDSRYGVGLVWKGGAVVDGKTWPVRDEETLWLPEGPHVVKHAPVIAGHRLTDLNALLLSAAQTSNGIQVQYKSSARALAHFDARPVALQVDGRSQTPQFAGETLLLPRGEHRIAVTF
jgi:hypothetical protein